MHDDILFALYTLQRVVNREIYQRAHGLSNEVATGDIRHSLEIVEEAIDLLENSSLNTNCCEHGYLVTKKCEKCDLF